MRKPFPSQVTLVLSVNPIADFKIKLLSLPLHLVATK